jgi:hypothetical protein
MRTRQGETFDWGYGFALPWLISRPQEGSGEECGRVSDWKFSEIRRLILKNTNGVSPLNFNKDEGETQINAQLVMLII